MFAAEYYEHGSGHTYDTWCHVTQHFACTHTEEVNSLAERFACIHTEKVEATGRKTSIAVYCVREEFPARQVTEATDSNSTRGRRARD